MVFVAKITISRAPKEKTISTRELVILANVNIYFGTFVFFNKGALATIECMACVVLFVTKSKTVRPISKYTGKLEIFRLNIVEKTTVITIIINSGFKILHK